MADYIGDYAEDDILYTEFYTHKLDGTPITLAGSPSLAVYKNDSTTQDTTGITLTVDHDSITGTHNVKIDLSSASFYARAADYSIRIAAGSVDGTTVVGYVIARFSINNRVTALGVGANTVTVTQNDDGASAMEGVSMWISTEADGDPAVASGTTSSTGVIVYYLDDGTFYAKRQKSGFNFTNPQTITVSGTTNRTLSDGVAVTTATTSSTLSVTYGDLRRIIGRQIGFPQDPTSPAWTAKQVNTVDDVLKNGCSTFYSPPVLPGHRSAHRWSFMHRTVKLSTVAAYSTGTVAISSGVVTGTGTVFPSWAADGELIVDGNTYEVDSRASNTSITLEDLTVTVAAGASYELVQFLYQLPIDYGGLDGPITYQSGTASFFPELDQVDMSHIRTARQANDITTRPQVFAVEPDLYNQTGGQRWSVAFWPIADEVYTFYIKQRVDASKLTASKNYPLGGTDHAATITQACLAAAELMLDDRKGAMWAHFMDLLGASVSRDQDAHTPEYLGYNGDHSDSYLGSSRTSHTNRIPLYNSSSPWQDVAS